MSSPVAFVTISVLRVPSGVFSFSRLTPPLAESRFSALVSRNHWMLVGGEENKRIEQVKLIVLPGFTNTADFPCITAAAAEISKK